MKIMRFLTVVVIAGLKHAGISEVEFDVMMKENPARLLGLR
jgi:predicted metal-dependent phosphotriesterase family hydrolase